LKRVVLILGAVLLGSGVAMAAIDSWQITCGLANNLYPYGNDFAARFGVAVGSNWNYDINDAAHPPIIDPVHDAAFVFDKNYYKMYQDQGYGWPCERHGPGIPAYPSPGLLKDTREPFTGGVPEFWQVKAYAPNEGSTISFVWEVFNSSSPFYVPPQIYVKLLGNADLEAVQIMGDVDLLANGPGQYEIPLIPQWGRDDDDNPIMHKWQFEAGVIPEPGTIVLMAGGLVGMAGLIRRKK
jgi:hypothetical protein